MSRPARAAATCDTPTGGACTCFHAGYPGERPCFRQEPPLVELLVRLDLGGPSSLLRMIAPGPVWTGEETRWAKGLRSEIVRFSYIVFFGVR